MLVTGCATFDQRAGFSDVSTAVEARSGKRVVWNLGTELDAHVAQEVQALLHDTLTVDGAIQVALLNNRTLQALYADLGVAQADLVQAGLLKNPVFDGLVHAPLAGGPLKVEFHVAMDFLDIFYIPLRKRVAAALFEEAKLQVMGAVLDFTATVRGALYRYQADEQMLELLQTIGFDVLSVARILRTYPSKLVAEWIDITLAAWEHRGLGFFSNSPQAFFLDNLREAAAGKRTPPDWWRKLRKEEERQRRRDTSENSDAALEHYLETEAREAYEKVTQRIFADLVGAGRDETDARERAAHIARNNLRTHFYREHPEYRPVEPSPFATAEESEDRGGQAAPGRLRIVGAPRPAGP
jgi:hypothetical protein